MSQDDPMAKATARHYGGGVRYRSSEAAVTQKGPRHKKRARASWLSRRTKLPTTTSPLWLVQAKPIGPTSHHGAACNTAGCRVTENAGRSQS